MCFKTSLFGVLIIAVNTVLAVDIEFVGDKQIWPNAIRSCRFKGGRLLVSHEFDFHSFEDLISESQEFWIGDYVYTDWFTVDGCYHMDTLDVQLFINARDKFNSFEECFRNGYNYIAFGITRGFCLQALPGRPLHDTTSCRHICDDGIGICGSKDGHYVSVYQKDNTVENVVSYSSTTNHHLQCASKNCKTGRLHARSCEQSLRAFCTKGDTEDNPGNWTEAHVQCIDIHKSYISKTCTVNDDDERWVSLFRGSFHVAQVSSWKEVATASRCKFDTNRHLSCDPEPVGSNATLPYVCVFDRGHLLSTTTTKQTLNMRGNTALVVGLTAFGIFLSIIFTAAAIYICFCRKLTLDTRKLKVNRENNLKRPCFIGSIGANPQLANGVHTDYMHYAEIDDSNIELSDSQDIPEASLQDTLVYEEPWGCKNTNRPLPDRPYIYV